MKEIRILFFSMLFITLGLSCLGQINGIANPGFEDERGEARLPSQWNACSSTTTPDILPGEFDVQLLPAEGESYVGLIIRDNGEQEMIGQKLEVTLEKGQCYEFTMDVARSDSYAGYNIPVSIKIWLSSSSCTDEQLIFHSGRIEDASWKEMKVRFTPLRDMNYIKISPVPVSGIFFNYKGNVLIDNISAIDLCSRT